MPIVRQRALFFSPGDDARDQLVTFVRQAKRSAHLNVYGLADPEVTAALVDRHTQGVLVSVVCDHTQASGPADKAQLQALVDAGIEVVITTSPTGAIDHEKVCIIDVVDGVMADTSAVWYGSYNFSQSAQKQRNYAEHDNDPSIVARFWSDWQASHDWGVAHHPEWQLKPTTPTDTAPTGTAATATEG